MRFKDMQDDRPAFIAIYQYQPSLVGGFAVHFGLGFPDIRVLPEASR
jgi:hypothetical protein